MRKLLAFLGIMLGTAVILNAAPAFAVRAGGNANGDIEMSGPHQEMHFNLQQGFVTYDNYDYVEGTTTLHYTADVYCFNVNTAAKEARFTFKIPEGHPGLSGLYVASYVKINNAATHSYTYAQGNATTTNQTVADNWCANGTSFTNYPVTRGVLYVK